MGRFNGRQERKLKILDRLHPLISPSDLVKYAKLFQRDLIASLHNQTSSLPMILNPIHKMSPNSGFGVAVAIGGSNGYVSDFRMSKKGVIKFLNRRPFSIPKKITMNGLFHLITKNILAVVGNQKKSFPIGISLAYPLKPILTHNFIDGELLYTTKGRNIEGLVGKRVGQEYHQFLIKEYKIDTRVMVANDAICLLLGGNGVEVVGVVGTGLNFAYWEKRRSIAPLKLSELPGYGQGDVAVNVESAGFDKIEGSKLRDLVDKASSHPGSFLSEKETAGAYLYQIFNTGKNEIVGKDFPPLFSTDQLNKILTVNLKNTSDGGRLNPPTGRESYDSFEVKSLEKAQLFAERIFHRSAQIVAIQLSGILKKIGKTKGIVPVVMEGGVFWKVQNYPALVNLYLNMILPEVIPSFARLFGSSRRGIAILARSGR